jgi:hypothetical protein
MSKKEIFEMRATDNRYAGELDKFNLAMRMIGHEARTGTIRACTGFTEDRIRKLYGTYFKTDGTDGIKRRRGKSPRQIGRFVNSAKKQTEATLLACLYLFCNVFHLNRENRPARLANNSEVELGERLCQAYETYNELYPDPQLSFEWAWNLYNSLTKTHELYFAWCESCTSPYIQDAYSLDYRRCPLCELRDHRTGIQRAELRKP